MKQAKFTAFLMAGLMLSTLGLTSCGDDDDDAAPMTNTEMLTRAQWNGDDIKFDGVSVKEDADYQDFFGDINEYRSTFSTNGTYTSIANGDTTTGNWMFMENETKFMTITSDQDTAIADITTLTNNEFVISDNDMNMSLHYKR